MSHDFISIRGIELNKVYPPDFFNDNYLTTWYFSQGDYNIVYCNKDELWIGIIKDVVSDKKLIGEKLIQLYFLDSGSLDANDQDREEQARDICKRIVSNIIAKDFSSVL